MATAAKQGTSPATTSTSTETPEQKFRRLTNVRVNRLLRSVKGLGKLARLKPTAQQTEKVFLAMRNELNKAEAAWKAQKSEEPNEFAV